MITQGAMLTDELKFRAEPKTLFSAAFWSMPTANAEGSAPI